MDMSLINELCSPIFDRPPGDVEGSRPLADLEGKTDAATQGQGENISVGNTLKKTINISYFHGIPTFCWKRRFVESSI